MKNIEYYLTLPYRLVIIPDLTEGGFTAYYPELPGCFTCAESLGDVVQNVEDAKRCWLEAELARGAEIPMPITENDYSGQFKLRLPKSLHQSLAEHAKEEGISMNQYCLYLLTKNDAVYTKKAAR